MVKITNIKAYEILDSRGNPTVKAQVFVDNGNYGDAGVPSGASTGSHEAVELRDNDPTRYHGQGVLKAIDAIEKIISPKLKGLDPTHQKKIDELLIDLDGTQNKSKLGANSILAVSLAICRIASYTLGVHTYEYLAQLYGEKINNFTPTPMFNIINGGLHGCGKFNFQEFLIIPKSGIPFNNALQMASEIYHSLKINLKSKNLIYSVGDEGGFTPQFNTNEEVLDAVLESIKTANYIYGKDVFLGLDLAATSFYTHKSFELIKDSPNLSETDYINYLFNLIKKYNLFSVEDGMPEDDWGNWVELTKKAGIKTIIIGDDLLVTDRKRLEKAIDLKACNGIIIKPNQIGTLSETLEVVKLARKANFKIIISHRSGETNDDFIADLAVGVGADFAKFGAPARGERVIKYNKLLWLYYKLSNKL